MTELRLLPVPKQAVKHQGVNHTALVFPEQLSLNNLALNGINATLNVTFSAQAFSLVISPSSIDIEYACPLSHLYAVQLLQQISEQHPAALPCIEIMDSPDFIDRGVILDISRDKVPTLDHLFKLIALWSRLRINQCQLYTEHTFAYQQHATVWQYSTPYTAQDIQKIDRYCRQFGIELIINQATFGHMERWLMHPEYQHLAEQTTGFYDQRGDFRPFSFGLNPLLPATTHFISDLLDELVPNFTSTTINLNFDETLDLGVGCSKVACEELGKGTVYVNYLNQLLRITERKQLKVQIFSDMLFQYPDILSQLPRDLTLLNWGYETDHPFDAEHAKLQQAGLPFQTVVSTCCFASISGRWANARGHMLKGAVSALKYGATGYHITEWGDMGHAQQALMPIPSYIYGAALAWGVQDNQAINVEYWLSRLYCFEDQLAAKWTIGLQNIYIESGINCPNCAFFGPLLFDQASLRHVNIATNVTVSGMQRCLNTLAQCVAELSHVKDLHQREQLCWTAKALTHACELTLALLEAKTRDVTALPCLVKQRLAIALTPLIVHYQSLWLKEHRVGGLQDSVGRLKLLLARYQPHTV